MSQGQGPLIKTKHPVNTFPRNKDRVGTLGLPPL